jgi:L-lysine exporter family protein LysE/ArgO
MEFLSVALGGAVFVLGVIAGIGPQNLNIMTHAIRRNHEYAVVTTCFLADSILILLGGIGLALTGAKWFLLLINVVGIIFLLYYLLLKIRDLNKPHEVKFANTILDKKTAIFRALAFTWLNPLVFVDTIIVIGGASTHYLGINHMAFIIGALLGDFIWLFGLNFISRKYADKLNQPGVWFMIDIVTILLVAYVVIKMISFFFA